MGLDLTAETIIRSGGALVWIAVGLVIALAGRGTRSWALRGIATYSIAFGCSVIPLNVTVSDPRIAPYGMAVFATAWAVAAAAIVVFFAKAAPPGTRRDPMAWAAAALSLVTGVAGFVIGLDPIADNLSITASARPTWLVGRAISPIALAGLTLALAAAGRSGQLHTAKRHAWALATVALLTYNVTGHAVNLNAGPATGLLSIVGMGPALLVMLAWLLGGRPGQERDGWWVAWGLLLLMLTVTVAGYVAPFAEALVITVFRVGSAMLLARVILVDDLLDLDLHGVTVRRGTVAAGALASLFIVAQVAQNFFSAEYGLLTGGIVAGAFLFAASPVQKAIERLGERKGAASTGSGNEGAYRAAVELALRDRRFEPAEEIALANLADRLGLTAMRAIEIRLAVETERGLR